MTTDKSIRETMLELALRVVVSDLLNHWDGDCLCGSEPFTDGEQCPICFGIRQCEILGIELLPPRGEQEDELS